LEQNFPRRHVSLAKVIGLCALIGLASFVLGLSVSKVPEPQPFPRPLIGVIKVYGYLISEVDRDIYLNSINYAFMNDNIVGVVLRVDSPGGYASIVEDVYYALNRLGEKKPIITVIEGFAASGGYYVALASSRIYAEPSAFVGNIGVIVYQPSLVVPSEAVLETGPFKYTGFSLKEFPFTVRKALRNFLNAVNASRSEKLTVSIEELSLGKLYLGIESLDLGLIDGIGSFRDGLNMVVNLTGVIDYEIVDLTEMARMEMGNSTGYELWKNGTSLSFSLLQKFRREPVGVYYLSPYYLQTAHKTVGYEFYTPSPMQPLYPSEEPIDVTDAVVIDRTHENLFVPEILGEFFGRIVEEGSNVVFLERENLTDVLQDNPKALIIISPASDYTNKEITTIVEYVQRGGKLVLIYDPSSGWAKTINRVSQMFGIYFSDGYLYDTSENYGVYRNIFVRDFAESPLFSGVDELTLFTATHIYTNGREIAMTSADTYLSFTEKQGVYSPIVENGNVIAIGDLTFLSDPFCYISDNEKFMENLVEVLTGELAG